MIFFISLTVEAKVVEVNYKLKTFKVDFDNEQVVYTAKDVHLTLKKKACNEHILKSFRIQMNRVLEGDFKNSRFSNSYSVKVDKVMKYDSLASPRAQFFSDFHGYFEQLKIEESLSCQK